MTGWRAGDPADVVEYGDDRRPRPGGARFPATVEERSGPYVQVRYVRPDEPGGGPWAGYPGLDLFWAESGWRAWDGELRWHLDPRGRGRPS
jgi:hypothetical protein